MVQHLFLQFQMEFQSQINLNFEKIYIDILDFYCFIFNNNCGLYLSLCYSIRQIQCWIFKTRLSLISIISSCNCQVFGIICNMVQKSRLAQGVGVRGIFYLYCFSYFSTFFIKYRRLSQCFSSFCIYAYFLCFTEICVQKLILKSIKKFSYEKTTNLGKNYNCCHMLSYCI